MGLKERVVELMQRGDFAGLEALVNAEPRAVRHLLGRLWDPDHEKREFAAAGLGAAAAAHPDLGVDVVRRLIWALNDESAMNGAYGLPALGEIGARAPELIRPFVGPMTSFLWDDGLRLGILRALARIAPFVPETMNELQSTIREQVDLSDSQERECWVEIYGEEEQGF